MNRGAVCRRIQEVFEIDLHDVVVLPKLQLHRELVHGLPGADLWPVPVTAPQEVWLEDRREDARHRPLQQLVFHDGDSQGS
jgi:hypothetical protein